MASATDRNSKRVEANRSPEYRNRRGGNRGRAGRTDRRRLVAAVRLALPLVEAVQAAEDALEAASTDRMKAFRWDELRKADAELRRTTDLTYIRHHADLDGGDPRYRGVLARVVEAEYRGHSRALLDGHQTRRSLPWKSDRSKVIRYSTAYIDEDRKVRR